MEEGADKQSDTLAPGAEKAGLVGELLAYCVNRCSAAGLDVTQVLEAMQRQHKTTVGTTVERDIQREGEGSEVKRSDAVYSLPRSAPQTVVCVDIRYVALLARCSRQNVP